MASKSAFDPIQERVFRSRVADFLFGLHYPATKQQVIHRARHNNTASQATEALAALPERTFDNLDEILSAISYYPARAWDVEGFPPEAIQHDEIEAERLRLNILRAERPASPR